MKKNVQLALTWSLMFGVVLVLGQGYALLTAIPDYWFTGIVTASILACLIFLGILSYLAWFEKIEGGEYGFLWAVLFFGSVIAPPLMMQISRLSGHSGYKGAGNLYDLRFLPSAIALAIPICRIMYDVGEWLYNSIHRRYRGFAHRE